MPGPYNKPWVPIDLDVADKTARIRVLEVQTEHTTKAIEKLNNKFDQFSYGISEQLTQVASDIKGFRHEVLNKELSAMEKKHEKELVEQREASETSAKVKFIWAGLGMALATLAAILIAIFKTRFGG